MIFPRLFTFGMTNMLLILKVIGSIWFLFLKPAVQKPINLLYGLDKRNMAFFSK